MEREIIIEMSWLGYALVVGASLMMTYEIIYIILGKIKKNNKITHIWDVLFAVISAVTVFFLLYKANGGVMRGFMVASVGIAMIFTKLLLQMAGKGIRMVSIRLHRKREKAFEEKKKKS